MTHKELAYEDFAEQRRREIQMRHDSTKFQVTKDIRDRIRMIVPKTTDTLEIKRISAHVIMVYAVWKGVRIAEAKYQLKVGESVFLNGCDITIDFEDDK